MDKFFLGVAENALHRTVGGGFERGVDSVSRGRFIHENSQVDNADVGRGHAHGVAVKLALQFRDDEVQRLGGAGGAGNHIDRSGAGATKVLVREVEEFLIVGVGMDGGHGATVDAERFLKNLGHGSEAIGGAGGIGNDVVRGGIVGLVVHR